MAREPWIVASIFSRTLRGSNLARVRLPQFIRYFYKKGHNVLSNEDGIHQEIE